MDTQTLLNERQKTHGNFEEVARISQALKSVYQSSENWDKMNNAQRESFDMFANKQARILSGDMNFHDHTMDIEGYSALYRKHSPTELGRVENDIVAVVNEVIADFALMKKSK